MKRTAYHLTEVTPFVGVWIETASWCWSPFRSRVTPFVGVWIETAKSFQLFHTVCCHTLCGCVDWNTGTKTELTVGTCHTLRGCVDLNRCAGIASIEPSCHTLRGCVDWNVKRMKNFNDKGGHTLRGCVDWNIHYLTQVWHFREIFIIFRAHQ